MGINKDTKYLFRKNDGIYVFQVFVPMYMRHLTGGQRALRKSTGTRDLERAGLFRDHMILEWKKLKAQFKPDSEESRIQGGIKFLHKLVDKNADKPQYTPPVKAKVDVTLGIARDDYAEEYSDKRKFSTLSKSMLAANLFLFHLNVPDIAITDIKRSQVAAFIKEQKKEKSSQTIQNYLSSLAAIYNHARRVHDGLSPDCPFSGFNIEAKATVQSYEPFEEKDLLLMMEDADRELRNVILFGLYSGMRLDEICSLRCSDILRNGTALSINIREAKTKAGVRVVPAHRKLIPIIDSYLTRAEHYEYEYLFPTSNRIERADGKKAPYFSQMFTRLRKKILPNATERQCFHSLRGMFITQLDRAGVPEQRIAEIVGHTRGETESRKTYSQGALQEELRSYINQVSYKKLK
jgi:integrase